MENDTSQFFSGLFSRGKSQLLRLAVSIQMLCDFLQTSSHHSKTLHDSQILILSHDPTEPLSSQQTNVLSSTSSQEDLIFSPSQNSEVDKASEGENGDEQNEIGAGANKYCLIHRQMLSHITW